MISSKLLSSNNILRIFYIILVLVVLILILERAEILNEHFTTTQVSSPTSQTFSSTQSTSLTSPIVNTTPVVTRNKPHKKIIYAIIPSPLEENLYFGTFIPNINNVNDNHHNNFVYTRSLESNKWIGNIDNSVIDDKSLIVDLFFDKYKHLMCIAMNMNDNEPEYNLYKKKTTDFKSEWVKIPFNLKIKSLCYDLSNNGNLLGLNNFDSQIYENRMVSDISFDNWIGPINYDIPVKKIMFDKEGVMIGIGLKDNYIYRKKDNDWRDSYWDQKNNNKTQVYDMFYDTDGCLIASTPEGIKKQLFPDFNSEFVDITKYKKKNEAIMEHSEVLKFRIGHEFLDDDFDETTELGRDLKRLYEFKKLTKDLCSNKTVLRKHSKINKQFEIDSKEISKQNREINDLYSEIERLQNIMDY